MPLHPEGITDATITEAIDFLSSCNPFAQHTWGWETGRLIDWRWGGNAVRAPGPEWFAEHGTLFRSPDGAVRALVVAEYGEDDACILSPSEDPGLVAAVIEVLAERHHARGDALCLEFADTATWLRALCEAAGMSEEPATGHEWEYDLSEFGGEVQPPDGFVIRPVHGDTDFPGISDCLGAAFGREGDRTPALRSLAANPWYRPELSIVAESPDGRVAAYCRGTVDPGNGLSSIDPVATHPGFQRLGLGRAVVTRCLATQRDLGARFSYIGSAPEPAPGTRLYRSLGPSRVSTSSTWTLPPPGTAG